MSSKWTHRQTISLQHKDCGFFSALGPKISLVLCFAWPGFHLFHSAILQLVKSVSAGPWSVQQGPSEVSWVSAVYLSWKLRWVSSSDSRCTLLLREESLLWMRVSGLSNHSNFFKQTLWISRTRWVTRSRGSGCPHSNFPYSSFSVHAWHALHFSHCEESNKKGTSFSCISLC